MMKKIFVLLISLSFLFSNCNKKELPEVNNESNTSESEIYYSIKNQYGVEIDNNQQLDEMAFVPNKSLIFVTGRKKGKLTLQVVDTLLRKKVFEWMDKEEFDTIYTIDEGYGVSSTYQINQYFIKDAFCSEKNNYAFILIKNAGDKYCCSEMYYIFNDSSWKKISCKTKEYFSEIYKWYNESLILEIGYDEFDYDDFDPKYMFFSQNGELIYEIKDIPNQFNLSEKEYIPINNEELIMFSGGIHGSFSRLNLKEFEAVWDSSAPFLDIPESTRIDDVDINNQDYKYVIFKFNLTYFSGKKESYNIKIDKETGELIKEIIEVKS